MKGIGGNLTAKIQTRSVVDNDIGESVETWTDIQTIKGWLDLIDADSPLRNFNAKIQESTHVFVSDYVPLTTGISAETSRMIINGKHYFIQYIDNPMELKSGSQLEFYLKFTGGQ